MPKTWQTDLAFVPQELEGVLTLLREREEAPKDLELQSVSSGNLRNGLC